MSEKTGDDAMRRGVMERRSKTALMAFASVMALAVATPASAQDEAAAAPDSYLDEEGYEVEELVVTASGKPRGAVIGDIPPEVTLSPREIRGYGASSVAELLEALEPLTGSSRGRGGGRPVMLLNGMRISSFSEVRDLPPEAISRVEILPEEVALKYGYRADQRVVNIVLRQRFRATTVESGVTLPTAGGRESLDGDINILSIRGDNRLQLDVKASRVTPLFESERDLIAPPVGVVDERDFRTLSPASQQVSVNAVYTRPIREGVSATLNGLVDYTETDSRLGLSEGSPVGERALRRNSDVFNAHLGLSMNGAISDWRWSFTGNADRGWNDSRTQRSLDLAGLPVDTAHSVVTSADAQLMFNGALIEAPAGEASTTLTAGVDTRRLESRSLRSGVQRSADLSRHVASLKASVDVPIASRRRDVATWLGDLSANANVAAEELSDFGLMKTIGAGLNWSPIEPLRVIASVTREDGAPSIQQLGDPEVLMPDVQVFDFLRGETVLVSRIDGGAPGLAADTRQVVKLGLNYKPFEETNLTLRADYTRSRITDVIAAFPTATAEIEAAFPERFVRDGDGRLTQIDVRPVNFARQESEQLRWGFNYSKPLGPERPPGGFRQGAGGAPVEGGPPRAGGGGGRGPGGGGFRGGRGGGGGPRGAGSLQFGVFHTLHLKDEILIRDGVPLLDLLDGSAAGNGGGQPHHELDVQAGYSKNGYGARLNTRWRSGTEVNGALGGDDLIFSDQTTVNLRLFADLGMQPFARQRPWLRGARVSLSVDNLFDSRLDVRTADGDTPVSYQPDYLDPIGRTVRISVRKILF